MSAAQPLLMPGESAMTFIGAGCLIIPSQGSNTPEMVASVNVGLMHDGCTFNIDKMLVTTESGKVIGDVADIYAVIGHPPYSFSARNAGVRVPDDLIAFIRIRNLYPTCETMVERVDAFLDEFAYWTGIGPSIQYALYQQCDHQN